MLSLSTEAAPELPLEALAERCRARGLDGQELVIASGQDVDSIRARAGSPGARIVALRAPWLDDAASEVAARCSSVLGVPISIPHEALPDRDRLDQIAAMYTSAGGRLLLGHPTKLDVAIETIETIKALGTPASLGLAWEVDPASHDLAEASAVLLAARELLGVVRLHGGGPEQREQDGRGVGPLFVELALSGYAGPIVLCPSSAEQVPHWTTWLQGRGSSGCGHAVSERRVELDVRDVEPRHRLETIMGAYRTLIPGATLHLTVDHDPVCMYYTLEATEPANSFSFQIVEHGPEVWRAEVTKR